MLLLIVSRGYNIIVTTIPLKKAVPILCLKCSDDEFSTSELLFTKSYTGSCKKALDSDATIAISAPLYKPYFPSSIFVLLKQSKVVVKSLYEPFWLISALVLVWINSKG